VLQGERQFARDNKTIGKFNLADIPPAPRGVPQIEVTSTLTPTAFCTSARKTSAPARNRDHHHGQQRSLEGRSREDAQGRRVARRRGDKAKKEEIETRNEVDNAVYRTEKLVKDNADKISADDKTKLETAIAAAKEALKGSGHRRHQSPPARS